MKSIKRKNHASRLIQVLLCTTIIVACITLSKYKSSMASKTTAQIAKATLTSNIDEIVLNDMEPGNVKEYYFEVGSTEERDVAMLYTVKLETGSYLPLSFELRRVQTETGEGTQEVLGENLLTNGNSTSEIDMPMEDKTHKYKLIVKWDEQDKNYEYSTEIDYVDIVIYAYQASVE